MNNYFQGQKAMNSGSKLSKQLYEKIPQAFPWVTDWKKTLKCIQKPDETVFDYFDRFEKVFKQYFSLDEVIDDTSMLFNSFFVKGLQNKLEQQVKKITT